MKTTASADEIWGDMVQDSSEIVNILATTATTTTTTRSIIIVIKTSQLRFEITRGRALPSPPGLKVLMMPLSSAPSKTTSTAAALAL